MWINAQFDVKWLMSLCISFNKTTLEVKNQNASPDGDKMSLQTKNVKMNC